MFKSTGPLRSRDAVLITTISGSHTNFTISFESYIGIVYLKTVGLGIIFMCLVDVRLQSLERGGALC